MLAEETLRTCMQYKNAAHREDFEEYRAKTYHRLFL